MTRVYRDRPRWSAALGVVLCGLLSVAPLLAGDDALARLVPDTAGLCIEAHDLAGALARLRSGELAKRIEQHPAMGAGLARGLAKLSAVRGLLEAQLGISDADAGVLLGGELLIAVWPGTTAGADGNGLLVLRCADEKLLKRVADAIVARQREAGRLGSPVIIKHDGRTVEAHTIKTNRADARAFLTTVGRLAIVTTDSRTLVHVVGAAVGFPHDRLLDDLPAYQTAIGRLNPDAPLRLFLNPRRWDEPMHALERPAAGRKALVHDAIGGLWQATDYVSASLKAADSLQLEIFFGCQQSRLSEPLRTVFSSLAGPSQLAASLPPNCLAAAAGRLDVGRMLTGLLDSQSLGKYELEPPVRLQQAAALALAGCLGPECGLIILAPSDTAAAGQPPAAWLCGLQTHGIGRGRDEPPAATWLVPWLRETVRLASAAAKTRGQQPALECTLVKQDGVTLTRISGLPQLPAGETLFLAEQQRMLWFGNSAPFTSQAAKGTLSTPTGNRRYNALRHPRLDQPSDVLLLDLAEIRRAGNKWTATSGRGSMGWGKLAKLLPLAGLADGALLQVQCDAACTAIALHIACD
ncbi:MAG TPA: hypothetical protein VIK18_21675 [Pirellulales bacterium]